MLPVVPVLATGVKYLYKYSQPPIRSLFGLLKNQRYSENRRYILGVT